MISYLKGQPLLQKDSLIMLVGGVGYGVKINSNTLAHISSQTPVLQEIELYIYTHVKEDKLELYGFEKNQELELFEMMIGVSGVGPSTALALVTIGPNQLIDAVQNAQVSVFTAIPRVGKKLAQKIIIDLRGKLGELQALDLGPKSQNYTEVYEALLALGFSEQDIAPTLETLDIDNIDTPTAIKKAMKLMKK